ncbi:FAD-dependent monooxygenase [Rhodobacteraceae bacterium F11138]|nr:FAD-dependent monooxygenase [Rhodobacteraceae bacterium F11138]
MATMDADIQVIGAGIGGVAAAIALAQRGARVRILEQAEAVTEVGAGLQISANGMVVLRALGVVDPEPAGATRSQGTEIRDFASGRLVMHMPAPQAGPTWYFHRADLLGLLLERARALGVEIELGQAVAGYGADGAGCVLTMADGTQRRQAVVVAADGGRSVARAWVDGAGQAQFSHQVAWRALVPGQPGALSRAVLTMGPGQHVVTYPLRGGALTNIVAVEERGDWTAEGWRQQGDPAELRTRFGAFGGAVGDVLRRVETAHIWALYLRPVARSWSRDGVVLLGDAAHPTLPFMAQGACLALEDAWVLADRLAAQGMGGLQSYEAIRRPRAAAVVNAAAGNARKFHLRGAARWAAQTALRLGGARLAPRYDWIYGHDVTA